MTTLFSYSDTFEIAFSRRVAANLVRSIASMAQPNDMIPYLYLASGKMR
jgi:hypothetical protein